MDNLVKTHILCIIIDSLWTVGPLWSVGPTFSIYGMTTEFPTSSWGQVFIAPGFYYELLTRITWWSYSFLEGYELGSIIQWGARLWALYIVGKTFGSQAGGALGRLIGAIRGA